MIGSLSWHPVASLAVLYCWHVTFCAKQLGSGMTRRYRVAVLTSSNNDLRLLRQSRTEDLLFFDAEERLVQVINFAFRRDAAERQNVIAAGKPFGWYFEDESCTGFGAPRPEVRLREDFRPPNLLQ